MQVDIINIVIWLSELTSVTKILEVLIQIGKLNFSSARAVVMKLCAKSANEKLKD